MENLTINNNKIELNYKAESNVIKDILNLCKIKHYHIINEDIILPYDKRNFVNGNGNRVYFDTQTNTFKESTSFWINSFITYRPKIVVLDYKPSYNKLNSLLIMLNSYNQLSYYLNYIPQDKKLIETDVRI